MLALRPFVGRVCCTLSQRGDQDSCPGSSACVTWAGPSTSRASLPFPERECVGVVEEHSGENQNECPWAYHQTLWNLKYILLASALVYFGNKTSHLLFSPLLRLPGWGSLFSWLSSFNSHVAAYRGRNLTAGHNLYFIFQSDLLPSIVLNLLSNVWSVGPPWDTSRSPLACILLPWLRGRSKAVWVAEGSGTPARKARTTALSSIPVTDAEEAVHLQSRTSIV